MKFLRIFAILIVTALLFTLVASAAEKVPSIEIKPAPETVVDPDATTGEDGEKDDLIITPPADKDDADEDVKENIDDALEDLEKALQDLIENFDQIWEDVTGDAPPENAIITDVFDARYESEVGEEGEGVTITFDVKVQGIEPDDIVIIITKPQGENAWRIVNYTLNEDGTITIEGDTKSAYAIIRDKAALPTDRPDGPPTAVVEYFVPAAVGIVVFGTIAAFCVVKLTKKRNAA